MNTLSIDFGSANSLAACVDETGKIILIRHSGESDTDSNAKHLPSYIAFHPDGSVKAMGKEAKSLSVTHPKEVVWGFKRLLGLPFSWLKDNGELEKFTYDIIPDWHDGQCLCAVGKKFTPVELVSILLKKMKDDAEEQQSEKFDSVILTTPAYFDSSRNSRLKEATRMAGFGRVQIIAEPVAAAIAGNLKIDCSKQITLTCDLGAGTLDISLGKLFYSDTREIHYETIRNTGNTNCGGIDIDFKIANWLIGKLAPGSVPASYRNELQKLAEDAKISLSRQFTVQIPIHYEDIHTEITLSQADLALICEDMLADFRNQLMSALNESGYSAGQIDALILIGGPIVLPIFRDLLQDIFCGNTRVMEQLDDFYLMAENGIVNRMTATAIGGAMYQKSVSDRCPFGYGFEEMIIREEEVVYKPEILIPMNAVYPHSGGAIAIKYSNLLGLYEFKLIKQVPLADSSACEYKFVSIIKFAVKRSFFANIVCEMTMNENKELVVRIRNLSRQEESVEYIGADIDPSSEIVVKYPIRSLRPKNIQVKSVEIVTPEAEILGDFTGWMIDTLILSVISSAKKNEKSLDRIEPVMKDIVDESKRQPVRYQQLFNQAGCLLHNSYSSGLLDPATRNSLECELNDWQDRLFSATTY
ncbi:MAG: Hsp70 family protein [Bacteroidota bacterium]